jgi:prepilin-type N-terminal cleavage/methylation domain-containing protein
MSTHQSPNHPISRSRNGVTLIEMLMVAALIGLLISISFPSVSSGLDTLRLNSAGDSLVSFLNGALNRAERRQQAIEIIVDPRENLLSARSTEPGFERKLEMPAGVRIANVLPPLAVEIGEPRRFAVYPGGTVPGFGVELVNRKGARLIVRTDPITGVPQVERVAAQ